MTRERHTIAVETEWSCPIVVIRHAFYKIQCRGGHTANDFHGQTPRLLHNTVLGSTASSAVKTSCLHAERVGVDVAGLCPIQASYCEGRNVILTSCSANVRSQLGLLCPQSHVATSDGDRAHLLAVCESSESYFQSDLAFSPQVFLARFALLLVSI